MGGGGLDVYGALPCGKVYSIFLPMPGKNWVLQYCAPQVPPGAAKPTPTNGGVVRLEAGLVPPSAEQQFDFHRLPVPEKDADKLVVLRGSIGKDGSVRDARVYRSVLAEMDAEAVMAFGRWKFKPATRAGDPVEVEVLLGIPVQLPEKTNEASSGELKSHE
jgi:TonB family protein